MKTEEKNPNFSNSSFPLRCWNDTFRYIHTFSAEYPLFSSALQYVMNGWVLVGAEWIGDVIFYVFFLIISSLLSLLCLLPLFSTWLYFTRTWQGGNQELQKKKLHCLILFNLLAQSVKGVFFFLSVIHINIIYRLNSISYIFKSLPTLQLACTHSFDLRWIQANSQNQWFIHFLHCDVPKLTF